MINERRRFRRFPVLRSLKVKPSASTKDLKDVIIKDISQGGARIYSEDFFAPQSFIKILFNPDVFREVGGRVVWARKTPYQDSYEMGLEFTNIDGYSRKELLLSFLSLGS